MTCALDEFLLSLRGVSSDDEDGKTTLVFVDDNVKPTGNANSYPEPKWQQQQQLLRKGVMSLQHPSRRSTPTPWKGNTGRNRWEEIAAIEKNNFRRSRRHQSMSLPCRSTDASNESRLADQPKRHSLFEDPKCTPNPNQLLFSNELPPSLRGMPY